MMDANIANDIVAVANAADLDLEVYEGYSGRGMYGEKTTGIVGDFGDLLAAVVIYASDVTVAETREDQEVTVEDLSMAMKAIRYDNMARQMIFY